MRIRVLTHHRWKQFEIEPSDTVWMLQVNIFHSTKASLDIQQLSFGSIPLDHSEWSLESYGIEEGSDLICERKLLRHEEILFRNIQDVLRKKRVSLELKSFSGILSVKKASFHVPELLFIAAKNVGNTFGGFRGTIRPKDGRSIADIVKGIASLKSLNLSGSEMKAGDIRRIGDGLHESSSIRELIFRDAGIALEGVNEIRRIVQRQKALRRLDLSDNYCIGDEGFSEFAKELRLNASLRDLNITRCGISLKGAKAIGEILEINTTLRRINICNSYDIEDEGFIRLMEGLERNVALQELVLTGCKMTPIGAKRLGEVLETSKTLLKLDISYNDKIGEEGLIRMVDALAIEASSLREWSLIGCGVTLEVAKHIGWMLEKNSSLVKLDLRVNMIGNEGCKPLATGLERNSFLKTLFLNRCGILSEAAERVATMLRHNLSLEHLDLSYNEIGDEGAVEILKALEMNTSLRRLNLHHCKISEKVFPHVKRILDANGGLKISGPQTLPWSSCEKSI